MPSRQRDRGPVSRGTLLPSRLWGVRGRRRPGEGQGRRGSYHLGDYLCDCDVFRSVNREAVPLTAKGAGGSPDLEAKSGLPLSGDTLLSYFGPWAVNY